MHYAFIDTANEKEFVEKSAALLGAHLRFATSGKERCALGLSGGSTPKPIYLVLGREKGIDWSKVWVFLLDERYVPADHPDSNQKLVRETLLKTVSIPEEHLIFPDTSLPLKACVSDYEFQVRKMLGKDSIDIATFGLGEDGHIASLFPPTSDEGLGDESLVIHTTTDRFAIHDRISLTLPLLADTKVPTFLLKGEAKLKVWKEMIDAKEDPRRWPAHAVLKTGRATMVLQR